MTISFGELHENERAKRLMAMGQMAASLAHEIRNPLGSMELYCTLLKRDLVEQPTTLELAERIHSGIKVLDRIISNCLQFARDLVPRRRLLADAGSIFNETASCLQPRAAEAKVELVLDDIGEHPISVDPYLVHQALLNVVINALDACTERRAADGSGRVQVLSDRRAADNWILTVTDNGGGISPENQEKIFDPFFTTKEKGTGLGLAIVHSIVSAHGGTVSMTTESGKGTCVVFVFPSKEQAKEN